MDVRLSYSYSDYENFTSTVSLTFALRGNTGVTLSASWIPYDVCVGCLIEGVFRYLLSLLRYWIVTYGGKRKLFRPTVIEQNC